mgnify:FL=1
MANEEEQESIEGLELESSDTELESESQEEVEHSQEEQANSEDEQDLDNVSQDDQESDSDDNSDSIQGTLSKKKKIILIAAAVSGLLIIVTLLLYLFGFFDSEPIKVEEVNSDKTKEMMVTPPKKKYTFRVKDINKKRLNRKLALLTRDEIIELDKPEDEVIVKNDIQEAIEQEKSIAVKEIASNNMDQNNSSEAHMQVEETVVAEAEKTMPEEISTDKMDTSVKEEIVATDRQEKMDTVDESVILKKEEIVPNKDIEFETVKKDNILVQEIIDNEVNENTIETTPTEEDQAVQKDAPDINMTEKPMSEEVMAQNDHMSTNTEEVMIPAMNDTQISNNKNQIEDSIEDLESTQKSFLMFAQVATIKTKLYLSFLQKINKIEKRISVCRNDVNHIEIFVGPFTSEEERSLVLSKINNSLVNDAFAIDFTQNEFDKRCKL